MTVSSSPGAGHVVVIGAGIIGLAHALTALDKGYSVTVVEANTRAVGASIRNFGHVCLTGQVGEFGAWALAGRDGWLSAASRAGFWAEEAGAYVVARTPTELAVLEESRGAAADGMVEMHDAARIRDVVGSADAIGGAFLPLDLRVNPRVTVASLAAYLESRGVTIHWGTRALRAAEGTVHTTRGVLQADHVFVCAGHELLGILPSVAESRGVRQCALQMARVDSPSPTAPMAAVLSGTSLLRYDLFSGTAAAEDLREELRAWRPELLDIGANVMFTRLPDGSIIAGDSHVYEPTVEPFLAEDTSDILLREVASLLGAESLVVRERWQGVYASSESDPVVIERVDPHTTAVTVATGVGMTISFGLAAHVVAGVA